MSHNEDDDPRIRQLVSDAEKATLSFDPQHTLYVYTDRATRTVVLEINAVTELTDSVLDIEIKVGMTIEQLDELVGLLLAGRADLVKIGG